MRLSMIMLFGIVLKLLLVLDIMVEVAILLVIVNRVLHSRDLVFLFNTKMP